ncbi:hypothetical protein DL93DRAFT_2225894 [Clavulina sp. PMI_390]|nr:hypothetical protein DL93DRAFT_2225894 [Clavulina sp. PMI_390]
MHLLDVVLQQIASDEAAVLNLPHVLNSLLPLLSSAFSTPSPAHKLWIARINSLLERPKHPGARWAGLCLAHRTALLSRDLLLTSADNWIVVALPTLSRDEPLPTLNAAIHLLATVYTSILDMPEFHRKVVIPGAQKFSIALLNLAEKPESPPKLQALCMHTITLLVHHHPTLHKGIQSKLQNLTLSHLSGSYPSTSDDTLVQSAADLHAVLHLADGKVNGGRAWRTSTNCAIASAFSALSEITSTLSKPHHVDAGAFSFPPFPTDNFYMSVTIALDRLRSMVTLLISLLKCTTPRSVVVPLGSLANLALKVLGVDSTLPGNESNGFVDPGRRILESSVVPALWKIGCDFVTTLSECTQRSFTPYVSQLASLIVHRIDQPLVSEIRLPFIEALASILTNSHPFPIVNNFLSTRLVKALLLPLSNLLTEGVPANTAAPNGNVDDHRSAKAKKKAKMYEGDEVFRTTKEVLLKSGAEGEEVLAALHVLPLLLASPYTSPAMASVASRLLLSLLLHLPQFPPSYVSSDPSLRDQLFSKTIWACEVTILHDASNPWLRRGLGLVAQIIGGQTHGDKCGAEDVQAMRTLSLLIHPHLPPNMKTINLALEGIPLYRAEGKDEREAREALRLVSLEDPSSPPHQAPNASINSPPTDPAQAIPMGGVVYSHPEPAPIAQQAPPAQVSPSPVASVAPSQTPHLQNPVTPGVPSWAASTPLSAPSKPSQLSFISTDSSSHRGPTPSVIESSHVPTGSSSAFPSATAVAAASHLAMSESSTASNNTAFIPLGNDDSDDDDDDAPIPEIDMRSGSEDELDE